MLPLILCSKDPAGNQELEGGGGLKSGGGDGGGAAGAGAGGDNGPGRDAHRVGALPRGRGPPALLPRLEARRLPPRAAAAPAADAAAAIGRGERERVVRWSGRNGKRIPPLRGGYLYEEE